MIKVPKESYDKGDWIKRQDQSGLLDYVLYDSGWQCQDGDMAELYIEKDNTGFDLECFSGIPASSIHVDSVDFITFKESVESLDFKEPFEKQCFKIANYLCSLFCEWIDVKEFKQL